MSDIERNWDLQHPLTSELFYHHRRLQEAAMKPMDNPNSSDDPKHVKRGQKGTHIRALQKGLNRIRKQWRLLEVDGKFGDNTYAALKACQVELNKWDISRVRVDARHHGVNFSNQTFQEMLNNIKSDGIAGPITLRGMDEILGCGWNAKNYIYGKCA